jgi:hypothetical protein
MAHFAELDENNVVKQVIVVDNSELLDENGNELEAKGIAFCQSLFGGTWVQTSYNANFRGNYAGVGMIYNQEKDYFISATAPSDDWYFTMGASEFFNRNITEFIGKPNLRFLEIGSYIGTSATEQLKNVLTGENSTITCVDIWDILGIEDSFDKRTAPYADKITKVKSDSKVWLEQNQDQRFDFIYIDGDHSAASIEFDTRLSWPMLKIGGVMALDDVLLNDETTQANNAFVESVKDKIIIIENGYQIWLRKTIE